VRRKDPYDKYKIYKYKGMRAIKHAVITRISANIHESNTISKVFGAIKHAVKVNDAVRCLYVINQRWWPFTGSR